MKAKMIKRASKFFNLDKKTLEELVKQKDLYSAISDMTGISRPEIKNWMHGLAYNREVKGN